MSKKYIVEVEETRFPSGSKLYKVKGIPFLTLSPDALKVLEEYRPADAQVGNDAICAVPKDEVVERLMAGEKVWALRFIPSMYNLPPRVPGLGLIELSHGCEVGCLAEITKKENTLFFSAREV